MPVVLPAQPPDITPPPMPNPLVWAALFVAVMAAGIAHTLLTWPHGTPTQTTWFWLRLLFFPAMAWTVLLGLRLLYVEQEEERIRAELEQWNEDRDESIRFAQEPLALLKALYHCAAGSAGVTKALAQSGETIAAQQPDEGIAAIPYTRVDAFEGATLEERYEACFVGLLEGIENALRTLPAEIPFEVYLQLDTPDPSHANERDAAPAQGEAAKKEIADLLAIWQRCWAGFGHRAVTVHAVSPHDSLMVLDSWLDEYGGAPLEKFALVVAAQLYARPVAGKAEAATALLLGWAPLAQRNALSMDALIHRPVAMAEGTPAETLTTALLWGNAEAQQVSGLWHAALEGEMKTELNRAVSGLGVASSTSDDPKGVRDLDHALGDAGAAAPWFALALAAEHAVEAQSPQAVAVGRPSFCMAVVQPSMPSDNAGSQG